MDPPYPGQGNPVPDDVGRGYWIYESIAWLDTQSQNAAPPGPSGQIALDSVRQESGIKFEAARVAAAMQISVDRLLEANKLGKLKLSNWTVDPRPGDQRAMRFRLSFDSHYFEITIGISGTKMGSA
jgi:hypothetical protein